MLQVSYGNSQGELQNPANQGEMYIAMWWHVESDMVVR